MKISVKTLKGEIFQITAESTDLVGTLKQKIQQARDDLGADRQKLIHAGKVLKDEQSVGDLGLSESDFIVCMVTKEVKKPAPAAAAAAAATPTPAPAAAPAMAPAPAAATPAQATPASSAPSTATPVAPPAAATSRAPARPTVQISPEATQALVGMGFPENEVRAALSAAMGNPDLAYEFLLTGIPDGLSSMMSAGSGPATPAASVGTPAAAAAAPSSTSGGAVSIESLRQHPQFNMLKQAVQQNPAMLTQVLELIGAQSPALLQAIHANNEAFIEMMNEPITDNPAPPAAPAAASYPPAAMGGGMDAAGAGMDPMQILQVLAGMSPAERAQLAPSMGMAPEQLEAYIQMIASLPPEQMRNIAARAGEMGGMRDPPNVIRLTEEEMAAVNRLVALGFSQQQAAQAYLSCDKNEELAANLLFEGGWMDDDGDMGDFGGDDAYN